MQRMTLKCTLCDGLNVVVENEQFPTESIEFWLASVQCEGAHPSSDYSVEIKAVE